MSFFSSLFTGSNPVLSGGINQAGQTSKFTNTLGQNLTSQAGNFYSTLLSGNPAATAKLLAPQIGSMQKQGQQAKQTMSQFGNRSGGTNAAGQTIDDKTRSAVSSMISSLTGQAASGAAGMGQSLIDTGLSALNQQTAMSQQQMENWSNSILGMGLTQGIGQLEGFGLSKIPGMPQPKAA